MALERVGVEFIAKDVDAYLSALGRANKATADLGAAAQETARQLGSFGGSSGGVASSVSGIGAAAARAGGGFSSFREIAVGALREVGALATQALAQLGGAIISFGIDSIQVAADYESTLNRFSAVTGTALDDAGLSIAEFDALFLELGAQTEFSSQQAADAAVELAKGGVDIPTIMNAGLEATLALAAAGELELAPAAEIVAKQLGVWADEGVTATQVADYLAQAANASTVDVDELALGLANVGGSAKVAGVEFDEMVQTMALIAPSFSSAADAGTSLKTFYTRLIPTTADATQAMADLGLWTEETGSAFYDAEGNFVGMEKTSALLYEATKDLSEEQRTLAFNTIFGSDAIRAAAAISETGADGYNAMGDAMGAAGGAAQQAELRQQGYNFAMESLKGSLETLQIILGRAVLPLLTQLINEVLIPGVDWIMQLAQGIGGAGESGQSAAQMLDNLGATIGGFLSTAVPQALGYLSQLGQQMLAWVGQSMPGWIGALGDFAVAAGQWVVDAVPGLLDNLASFLKHMGQWVTDNAPAWGEALLDFQHKIILWVSDALPGLADNLGQFFNEMVNWVVDNLPTWITELAKLGASAIAWVINALPGLSANLVLMAGEILGWLAQTIIDVAPKLMEMGAAFLGWVAKDVIPTLPTELGKMWNAISTWFVETTPKAIAKLVELGQEFWEWVTNPGGPVSEIGPALQKFSVEVVEFLVSLSETALNTAFDIGIAILEGIASGLAGLGKMLVDSLTSPVEDAYNGLKGLLGIQSPSRLFWFGIGIPIGEGVTGGVAQALERLQSTLIDPMRGALTAAQSEAGTFLEVGQTLGAAMGDGVVQAVGEAASGVASTVSQMATLASGAGTSSAAAIYGSIGGVGRIASPASPGQIAHMGMMGNTSSTTNNFNYAPVYQGAPRQPSQDFAIMATFAGAGG